MDGKALADRSVLERVEDDIVMLLARFQELILCKCSISRRCTGSYVGLMEPSSRIGKREAIVILMYLLER